MSPEIVNCLIQQHFLYLYKVNLIICKNTQGYRIWSSTRKDYFLYSSVCCSCKETANASLASLASIVFTIINCHQKRFSVALSALSALPEAESLVQCYSAPSRCSCWEDSSHCSLASAKAIIVSCLRNSLIFLGNVLIRFLAQI